LVNHVNLYVRTYGISLGESPIGKSTKVQKYITGNLLPLRTMAHVYINKTENALSSLPARSKASNADMNYIV
jgi:hypothetical protein